jgi:hypothetical protein
MARIKLTLMSRFLGFVSPDPNSGCWLWTGCIQGGGYGVFDNGKDKTTLAHRVAYTLFRGLIPDGLQLDHKCRVRLCVNPWHLEAVTLQENLRRGLGNAAAIIAAASKRKGRGFCPRGHVRDQANTYTDKRGRHACRACSREKAQERRDGLR